MKEAVYRPSTARDLRRTNRSAILRELLFTRESTRQGLAGRTQLSPATVGLVVADLLQEGLVVEVGTEESNGGRPRTLLRIDPDHGLTVGVDVGESGLRVEAFDLGWQTRASVVLGTDVDRGDVVHLLRGIVDGVDQVLASVRPASLRLLGVGVGVPGIVEGGRDGMVHATTFGWGDVPLGQLLSREIGAPVVVRNGAKAMGQAEMWFGAGRGVEDVVVALLGTGVGAGVFTNGRLYRGSRSSAGEWGHIPIVVGGQACRCGSHGCLEAYIGERALLARWDAERPTSAVATPPDADGISALIAAYGRDDAANRVVDGMAEYLGAGLATLINLFNPQRIVLAGSVGLLLTPEILRAVRTRTRAYALRQPFESVEITLGELGIDAVALGAATLVVEDLLAHGFERTEPVATPAVTSVSLPSSA